VRGFLFKEDIYGQAKEILALRGRDECCIAGNYENKNIKEK